MLNILNGGKHASDSVDFQEFMIVPLGATSFHKAMQMSSEVYHSLRRVLEDKRLSTNVGDEGGFAPQLSSNKDALELILAAIDRAGYKAGRDLSMALDPAASTFYQDGKYVLSREGVTLSPKQMIDYYVKLVSNYPIISIEDEVILFHTPDKKLELDFEFENRPYQFVDMETGETIRVQAHQIRAQYLEKMSAYHHEIKARCLQYRIDYHEADINAGYDYILQSFFVKRRKMNI